MAAFGKLDLSMLEQPAGPAREMVGLEAIGGCGPAVDSFPLPAVQDVSGGGGGGPGWPRVLVCALLLLDGACQHCIMLPLNTAQQAPSAPMPQPPLLRHVARSRRLPSLPSSARRYSRPLPCSWTRLSGRWWSM